MRPSIARLAAAIVVAAHAYPAAAQDGGGARAQRLLAALVAAYPDFLAGAEGNELVWKDGTRMPFDDGKGTKPFEAMLDAPDLEDMFYAPYPLGAQHSAAGLQQRPGPRAFPTAVRQDVRRLHQGRGGAQPGGVVWLPSKGGQRLEVTRINGMAAKLQAVSDELDRLPERFTKYLKPSAGTYNCRVVAGTKRVSAHGHGIAIDIATAHSDYWLWTKPRADGRYPYANRIPMEIVEVFEKHGFIWGGKWYHYDTMHFEYRPEIVGVAR